MLQVLAFFSQIGVRSTQYDCIHRFVDPQHKLGKHTHTWEIHKSPYWSGNVSPHFKPPFKILQEAASCHLVLVEQLEGCIHFQLNSVVKSQIKLTPEHERQLTYSFEMGYSSWHSFSTFALAWQIQCEWLRSSICNIWQSRWAIQLYIWYSNSGVGENGSSLIAVDVIAYGGDYLLLYDIFHKSVLFSYTVLLLPFFTVL